MVGVNFKSPYKNLTTKVSDFAIYPCESCVTFLTNSSVRLIATEK